MLLYSILLKDSGHFFFTLLKKITYSYSKLNQINKFICEMNRTLMNEME